MYSLVDTYPVDGEIASLTAQPNIRFCCIAGQSVGMAVLKATRTGIYLLKKPDSAAVFTYRATEFG